MNGKLLIFISALVLIGVYSGLRPSPSLATNCSAVGDACCGSITSILYCNPPASECDSTIHCKIPAPTTPPTTCDKVGDPCCGSYTGGFRCFNNLNCDNTIHCAACGNVGQTCCPGNTCSFGNCSSGVCVSLINPPAASSSALCGTDNLGVSTAIGCLMAGDPKQLVSQLLGWGVGVGGGIAFDDRLSRLSNDHRQWRPEKGSSRPRTAHVRPRRPHHYCIKPRSVKLYWSKNP